MKHHTSQRKQNHIPITFNLLCWFINFPVQAPTIKITLCHHRWRYAQLHPVQTSCWTTWLDHIQTGDSNSMLDFWRLELVLLWTGENLQLFNNQFITGMFSLALLSCVWASDEIFVFSRWDIELFDYPVWSWRVLTENIHLFTQLWLQMSALCQLTCAFCVKRGGGPLPGGGHTAAEV